MNKYVWFMLTTFYLIVITYLVASLPTGVGVGGTDVTIGSGVPDALQNMDEISIQAVFDFAKVYLDILFFQVDGLKPFISLLFIHPVMLANGVLFIELLPFT